MFPGFVDQTGYTLLGHFLYSVYGREKKNPRHMKIDQTRVKDKSLDIIAFALQHVINQMIKVAKHFRFDCLLVHFYTITLTHLSCLLNSLQQQ